MLNVVVSNNLVWPTESRKSPYLLAYRLVAPPFGRRSSRAFQRRLNWFWNL